MNQKKECLFCEIAKKNIPARIIYEDETALAFEDIKPHAPVHILVIPKEHIEKTSDLTEAHERLIGHLVLVAKDVAKKSKVENSGYRIVINCNRDAGQEIFHLHIHLLGGRKFTWPPG
ncbi:MAG: histidine triad nucleotide-binding protein [Candidatus Omnitrophica bacterium]|nr:histidine triad nucleotide-binding protein [Candidatus Omnitrophota bacterium]MCM8790273.1 histidine triad nucleotide-binding protein [Candidatus Omnitrophota bacterium]